MTRSTAAMACGDRYHQSIRTEAGYTPSNACGSVCLPGDYDGWYVEASRWNVSVRRAWDALQGEAARRRVDVSAELSNRFAQYQEVFARLPTSSLSALFDLQHWPTRGYIDDAIATTLEAACLLELLEDAIRRLGASPPAVATGRGRDARAPSLPSFSFGGSAFRYALIFAAGGYVAYRLLDRKGST